MKKAILGKKIGMTQMFTAQGAMIPVTVVEAGPCTVVQKKTVEHDGYDAIKVGFGTVKEKHLTKPEKGQYLKAGVGFKKYLREFKLEDISAYEAGQVITAEVFAEGDHVDVSGISRGKGFTGVIRRWNQSRGPMAHGSRYHRAPGSMGPTSTPGHVRKGKHLSGHMGSEKTTIQNLEVVRIDGERNLVLIKGSVPGAKGCLLVIRDTLKA